MKLGIRNLVLGAALAAGAGACSLTPAYLDVVSQSLDSMHGRPINDLRSAIGRPDHQTSGNGGTTYVWEDSHTFTWEQPTSVFVDNSGAAATVLDQGLGTIGTTPVGSGNVSTGSTVTVREEHSCIVTVRVDQTGRIATTRVDGTSRGCATYAEALSENN